jgi:hypothetical protein
MSTVWVCTAFLRGLGVSQILVFDGKSRKDVLLYHCLAASADGRAIDPPPHDTVEAILTNEYGIYNPYVGPIRTYTSPAMAAVQPRTCIGTPKRPSRPPRPSVREWPRDERNSPRRRSPTSCRASRSTMAAPRSPISMQRARTCHSTSLNVKVNST